MTVPAATLTAALALTALALASQARAQAPADSYRVGEKVEVRPVPARDAWEPGVVTDFTYDTGQLVVRWPANERAFEDRDVRHLPPAPAQTPEPAAARARAPAARATLSRASEATPPDESPIPPAPRR